MDIGGYIGMMKDIIMSIAAGITAWVAYTGLNKWKKGLRGKIDFDTAHALIKATYKVRDELKYARSPFIPASEFPEGYYGAINKNSKEEGDAFAYIYTNRMKPVIEATQELEIRALEAEALWGKNIQEYVQELRGCCSRLNTSFNTDLRNIYSNDKLSQKSEKFHQKIRKDTYASEEDDDPLSIRIRNAIKTIEEEIRLYLDKK